MRVLSPLSLCCALWLAATSTAAASKHTDQAELLLQKFMQSKKPPGLAVSVGVCDRIVWSAGYGFADLEQQVPVDPAQTKFRVGSVAKPMTALALSRLVIQKRIDLDADVRQYVPSFPKKAETFTVRQLAGHLAGIRHYRGDEAYSRKHFDNVQQALAIFQDDDLIALPGKEWKYSSYGYNLLSAVIEAAAEKPFLDYMAESVFTPLRMKATVPDQLDLLVSHRGRYYLRRDGTFYNEPEVDNSNKWASGGLLSTTDDLVRFGLAYFDDAAVSPVMRQLQWSEQKTDAGNATGYGMGWRVVVDAENNTWLGHGGGAIGGTTQFWLFPEQNVVIASASNLTELDYADLLPQLRALFIKHPRAGENCEKAK